MKKTLDTRALILSSAIKEFSQYGFEGGRIDRIAKRGKINKAMIYYHFKSKEQLYEVILSGLYNELRDRVFALNIQDRDSEEKIRLIITTVMEFIERTDQNFVKIMLREISSGGKYFIKLGLPNIMLPFAMMTENILQEGMKKGLLKPVHPQFTYILIMGSIIFFNAMRVTLLDTEVGKKLFTPDCFDLYSRNLLDILTTGIIRRQE